MRKILFPTDFSKAAENAFIYALKMANHYGASVTVLHVYNLLDALNVYSQGPFDEYYEQLRNQKFQNYQDSVKPLDKIAQDNSLDQVDCYYVMEEGFVEKTIMDVAKRDEVDLIIMGTTGASGLKEVFLGSIAGEMLENAPCKVLAIPQNAIFDGTIDNIALTISYQEEEKRALHQLLDWAQPLNPQIHVINIDLAHTEFYNQRMNYFKKDYEDNNQLHFHVIDGTDFTNDLTKFLHEQSIDLLAMVTHQRNFINELFHYSKAKAMSYHTDIPILSIPSKLLHT